MTTVGFHVAIATMAATFLAAVVVVIGTRGQQPAHLGHEQLASAAPRPAVPRWHADQHLQRLVERDSVGFGEDRHLAGRTTASSLLDARMWRA